MRRSVAVVTTYYRPVLGGAESAAEHLATFLVRRGHRVLVVTKRTSRDHPVDEVIDGVTIVRLPPVGERAARGKWLVLPAVVRALIRHRATIDVVCCIDYRGIGLGALIARAFTHAPVVFQAQTEGVLSGARVRTWLQRLGIGPQSAVAQAATWPIRALYGRADGLGCISRGIEREALEAGVPRARVHYLPNPVDTRVFAPVASEERDALRTRLGLPTTAVVAVFVGRLSREKGVMELVRAWDDAKPEAELVVIGPPMTDHPWDVSKEAADFVTSHGLAGRVRFLGGQPAEVVADWLKAADFSVQPSHFEAMGLAAAEAMAAGLPVIASDTGGFRDFITTEVTGVLVPVGDVRALGLAIARLAGDASLRARLGREARSRAEEFDERRVLEQFARLIDGLPIRG